MSKRKKLFYTSITENYDNIFPLNDIKKNFLATELEYQSYKANNILDLGCSTGQTDIFLAEKLYNCSVTGIDLDKEMIQYAKDKILDNSELKTKINFLIQDMRTVDSLFRVRSFNSIICLGNSFVHLLEEEERKSLLRQVFTLLKPGGKFIMQIINYENILANNIKSLPLIDNEKVKFTRNYKYLKTKNIIEFSTDLEVKAVKESENITNLIELYPLRFSEVSELFSNSGFDEENVKYYGNYSREDFQENSSYNLIVVAQKR